MIRLTQLAMAVCAGAAAILLGVVACSQETAGRALPVAHSTTTTTLQTTISRGNEALDRVDPCALLKTAEISQFGANAGVRVDGPQARACDWSVPGGNGGFQIALRNSQSLGEIIVKGGTIADQPVGSRKGKILRDNLMTASCTISFEIATWSRVDVYANARDTPRACDYSLKVAILIEPRLPKGT